MDGNFVFAFSLTLLAGLSTGIGGLIVYFTRQTNQRFLALGLGFSAGVMIYISFAEMLSGARERLGESYGDTLGGWLTAAGFFGGMLVIGIIDRAIPAPENPHEPKTAENVELAQKTDDRRLLRMGLMTAIAIAIHNFPEGLATLVAALSEPTRGVAVAVAIAIHNIPEGITVAIPLFYATGNKRHALTHAFLSGMSEPIGAVAGYVVVRAILPESAFGVVDAAVAGIMVFISLDQLIPNAHQYGKGHAPIYGLVGGMVVMAITLLLLT
jgi:ZIP family zinc transporter